MRDGRGPKRVLGRDGKVVGLETVRTQVGFRFQRAGSIPRLRRTANPVIECDTVILAIGQTPRLDFLTPEDGVEISGRGLDRRRPRTR